MSRSERDAAGGPAQRLARGIHGAALTAIATVPRHTNVLQHLAGYFKRTLDVDSREELQASIEDYSKGRLPLIAPLTLIRHHVRHSI